MTSLEAFEAMMSQRVPLTALSPRNSDWSFLGIDSSDGVITENTALSLSAFWAGVTLISEAMATMPCKVWRSKDGGGRDWADQHPTNYALMKTNNGWMVPSVFKSYVQGCVLMSGNSVGEVVRNFRGQCAEIYPWLPRSTIYDTDDNGDPKYGIYGPANIEWFPYTEVVHIKGFSSDGHLGRSILQQARGSLSLMQTVERFGKKYFNKGRPAGFLTKPGNMTIAQRDLLRAEWKELYEGVENALSIGILSNGLDWKEMGYSNEDAQFLQNRAYGVLEIARWFRVPPHMLAEMSKATEVNIEQLMLEFLTFTLLPWMTRWEDEMNLKLFTPKEQFKYSVKFDLEAFLRGDKLTRAKVEETDIRNGTRTLDEVREDNDRNPYPDELGSEPLIMASQLDYLRNVKDGTSALQAKPEPAKATP